MDTNNAPFTQQSYRHERGPEYNSPASWRAFANESIEMLAGVLLNTATGASEKRLHGVVTIRYDHATVRAVAEAVGKIRDAISTSEAIWLPGAEETQARLPAARADERFQAFLMGMDDGVPQKNGGVQ